MHLSPWGLEKRSEIPCKACQMSKQLNLPTFQVNDRFMGISEIQRYQLRSKRTALFKGIKNK